MTKGGSGEEVTLWRPRLFRAQRGGDLVLLGRARVLVGRAGSPRSQGEGQATFSFDESASLELPSTSWRYSW